MNKLLTIGILISVGCAHTIYVSFNKVNANEYTLECDGGYSKEKVDERCMNQVASLCQKGYKNIEKEINYDIRKTPDRLICSDLKYSTECINHGGQIIKKPVINIKVVCNE